MKLIETINHELKSLSDWLNANRLSLNLEKTVAINFSTREHLNTGTTVKLNNVEIKFSETVKYLGVILDNSLTFGKHVRMICDKISKNIGLLGKVAHNAPKSVLKMLYYSIVYPYIIYCNSIWGAASSNILSRILILQKRAVRIISGSGFLDHSSPLFFELEIVKIEDVYKITCCTLAFKNKHLHRTVNTPYNTRHSNDLYVPYQRLTLTQRSSEYNVPRYFNDLPNDLKELNTLGAFKRGVKLFFISKYVNSVG